MTDLPDPDIVDAAPRLLVGVVDDYTLDRRGEIPNLYHRFFDIAEKFDAVTDHVLYGVSMNAQPDGSFRYGVGWEVAREIDLPEGASFMSLVGGTYAVFTLHIAPVDLPSHFDAIFARWLPEAHVAQREGAVFERYLSEPDAQTGTMTVEIWVPVAD
ncbi:GyrI-like domain-containing protein [Maritimibacter sp. DP1N21-5]|uniref:GyrI-like domain-containing protein n=1 Tax=Maritimibacter sp. DP1N21-5 TaxID=2836867 RepID=UPI001C46E786|nr:GyrI-like domain-containing protein [Maritimibacter sp. DP1N21-5]MBV7407939.1 GyrI-like domain-containing protein [Maritimibacter sp. DP1N21-5]